MGVQPGGGCAVDGLAPRPLIVCLARDQGHNKTDVEDAAGLQLTARRLGEACVADQVILFGSRATGQAASDSDVDLALILPDGSDARAKLNQAHRLLWPRSFPIDLVAISASVWRRKSTFLARQITAQGVVLYDRGAA